MTGMISVQMEVQTKLAIMRVENGWLIRTDDDFVRGAITPLRIAKTPDDLAEEIRQWALKQEQSAS